MAERRLAGQTLVYFGDGKGKTTSAFGVALRAVGRGWKVLMIQYTKMGEWPKGEPMGEINGARRLAPDFEVISTAIGAVSQGQWDLDQLLELIRTRPRELNLLVTGHDDKKEFIDQVIALADLATEMRKVKHPFDEGHQARKGLDY